MNKQFLSFYCLSHQIIQYRSHEAVTYNIQVALKTYTINIDLLNSCCLFTATYSITLNQLFCIYELQNGMMRVTIYINISL